MTEPVDDPAYWEARYRQGTDRWELGMPSPPLAAWLRAARRDGGPAAAGRGPGRAFVPGCGRGHEVLLLAELGWAAVGLDLAASPIEAGRAEAARRGLTVELVQGDLFAAPARPGWAGTFDLVVEHTCFCAIDPARRDDYVDVVTDLLVPGGRVVALLWDCGNPSGPPWTTSPGEMRARFARRLEVTELAPAVGSAPGRTSEWLLVARKA